MSGEEKTINIKQVVIPIAMVVALVVNTVFVTRSYSGLENQVERASQELRERKPSLDSIPTLSSRLLAAEKELQDRAVWMKRQDELYTQTRIDINRLVDKMEYQSDSIGRLIIHLEQKNKK